MISPRNRPHPPLSNYIMQQTQFCPFRHERGSLIITTNIEFLKRTEMIGDEQMTPAFRDCKESCV
jgi:hypothetical protein